MRPRVSAASGRAGADGSDASRRCPSARGRRGRTRARRSRPALCPAEPVSRQEALLIRARTTPSDGRSTGGKRGVASAFSIAAAITPRPSHLTPVDKLDRYFPHIYGTSVIAVRGAPEPLLMLPPQRVFVSTLRSLPRRTVSARSECLSAAVPPAKWSPRIRCKS